MSQSHRARDGRAGLLRDRAIEERALELTAIGSDWLSAIAQAARELEDDGGSAGARPGVRPLTARIPPRAPAARRPATTAGHDATPPRAEGAPVRRSADTAEVPSALPDLRDLAGQGARLPSRLLAELEAALGFDLDAVRVHTGDGADHASRLLGARAFARGQDIGFRAGAYDPDSPEGVRLIAHEVMHTTQGPTRSSGDAGGPVSHPDDPVEREADGFADRFMAGRAGTATGASSPRGVTPERLTKTEPASATDAVRRVPAPAGDGPAAPSPRQLARMADDVRFIVAALQATVLAESDQWAIVAKIENQLRADHAVSDIAHGRTDLLDRFLLLLKGTPYQRANIGTLFQTQHAIVFDDLWHRLQGQPLARFRQAVAASRGQATTGPDHGPVDDALSLVVAPVFWRATALLSLGLVDHKLFDDMHAAVMRGGRPGGSIFMEQLGVVLVHGFDFFTLGAPRAAYEAAVVYAEQHPDCSMSDIRMAGLLGGVGVILPIGELRTLGQALGLVALDAKEVRPDAARAILAFLEGALKLIVLGAAIHAKVKAARGETAARSKAQLHDELNRSTKSGPGQGGEGEARAADPQGRPAAEGAGKPEAGEPSRSPGKAQAAPTEPISPRLAELRELPRAELLREVQRATAMGSELVFWEDLAVNAWVKPVAAGRQAAARLGVRPGTVIGYEAEGKAPTGSAVGDLGNIETLEAPYPDPFRPGGGGGGAGGAPRAGAKFMKGSAGAAATPKGPGAAHVHDEAFSSNRVFEPSPKHAGEDRAAGGAKVAKEPTDGKAALDLSFEISPSSPRRIGVDPRHKEFVVFDRTGNKIVDKEARGGIYHGHVRSWNELEEAMKRVLMRQGVVRHGKILVDPKKWVAP